MLAKALASSRRATSFATQVQATDLHTSGRGRRERFASFQADPVTDKNRRICPSCFAFCAKTEGRLMARRRLPEVQVGILALMLALAPVLYLHAQTTCGCRPVVLFEPIEDEKASIEPVLPIPRVADHDRPLPINLPTALELAQAAPLDIAIASERLQA